AFHALRIKGFAKVDMVADIAAISEKEAEGFLQGLLAQELALFREQRALWQITPAGKEAHKSALAADTPSEVAGALKPSYEEFLVLNESFKQLCGDWQLKDGAPNDHSDAAYDKAVIARLVEMNVKAVPVVESLGAVLERLMPYVPRLHSTSKRVVAGENNMFTGVMCGSYHDVWMELHEDLILTQGIDRAAEGSF
ncbi:MAG: MarR family transcriptional regulator, partial [Actinobacteria bacterium]|nr:MarR family transcriptional regulator [Actinomycetota bacterium]